METNNITLLGCAAIISCLSLTSCVTGGHLMNSANKPDNPQDELLSKLKKPIAESLVTFKDDDNGSVYVSVAGKKLFKPGSAAIDGKGKKALRPLADLLYTSQEDISMEIKGAIDN